jgi:DNA-binding HxlR family transcriptional regulator
MGINKNLRKSIGKLRSYLKRKSKYKNCFYNDCEETPISSHSIQNNKILSELAEDGYVLKIDIEHTYQKSKFILTEKGRNVASTFKGFCGRHDKEIFASIEDYNYNIGNKKQEFLFAYRALAKEYHIKKTVYNMADHLIRLSNEEYREVCNYCDIEEWDKNRLDNHFKDALIGTGDNLDKLKDYKKMMNINLDKERYYKIESDVIKLPIKYSIAASSMFFMEYDNRGNLINNFNRFTNMKPIFFTIFPQGNFTYIIFSYFKTDKNYYDFINPQIISQETNFQKIIVSNILAIYVENFFVSPLLWEYLEEEVKERFLYIFSNNIDLRAERLLLDRNINLFRSFEKEGKK